MQSLESCIAAGELRKKRISKQAIEALAHLHKAVREAKIEASNITSLPLHGDSVNTVAALKNTQQKVVAFYKEGRGGEKAAGIMETLIWDMAVIFEAEDLFVATKNTSLQIKKQFGNGEIGKTWNEQGGLTETTGLTETRRGGIQAAQEGLTLNNYLNAVNDIDYEDNLPSIDRENLIKAVIMHYVFGMFDAHEANIIIDNAGKIKFFDNTRSMPLSNGVIQRRPSELLPAFRSSLFKLDREKLTKEEINLIKTEIEKLQSKVEELEQFLESKKKELSTLPPGWWDTKQALNACIERINRLAESIENPKVEDLKDLIFEADVDLKYFAAMQMILSRISTPKMFFAQFENRISFLGTISVDVLIKNIAANGLDPIEVRSWCEDFSLSLSEIIDKGFDVHKNAPNEDVKTLKKHGDEVISYYESKAAVDLKDINRDYVDYYALQIIKGRLKNEGIVIQNKNKVNVAAPYNNMVVEGNETELSICYRDAQGKLKEILLDYCSSPGSIKVADSKLLVRQMTHSEAEERLQGKPSGTFLFRSIVLFT